MGTAANFAESGARILCAAAQRPILPPPLQGGVLCKKLGVLSGEDIVRYLVGEK